MNNLFFLQLSLCRRLKLVQLRPEFFLGFPVHPVNEQNAVQMIHFVLRDAREKATAIKLNRFAFAVQCLHGH